MNNTTWLGKTWRSMAVPMLGAGFLGTAPAVTHARADAPLDLATIILHSDDLDWLVDELDLVGTEGYPYGSWFSTSQNTFEEIMNDDMYAPGRGALDLTLSAGLDIADILEDAEWSRTQSQLMVLPEPGSEDELWSLGVGVSIEEFSDEAGAAAAFDAFQNEDLIAGLTESQTLDQIDPPALALKLPAVMWEMEGSRWDGHGSALTISTQLDNRIVSVAFHSSDHGLPEPEILATLLDLQLKRIIHAEHLHNPGLASCAPRFDSAQVADQHEEYGVINRQPLSIDFSTSYADLDEDQELIDTTGIVHSYLVSQSITDSAIGVYDGTLWFAGHVRAFTDDLRASAYVAATEERLNDIPVYSNVEEIDDLPAFGDAAVAFNYVAGDDYPASLVSFQHGENVYTIRLGSMTDYQPETVIELAEEQLDRLEDDDCAHPLALPAIVEESLPTRLLQSVPAYAKPRRMA